MASHSGKIWAEATTHAGGMTICVWWPHTPTLPPESADLPADLTPAPARLPLDRRQPVLLILEGDPRMARYLRANAEAHGYLAHSCISEEDALKCIDREEPDLVLVDSGMPAMADNSNGWIANVLSYARYQFGNMPKDKKSSPIVTSNEVKEIRKEVEGRNTPWTLDELKSVKE